MTAWLGLLLYLGTPVPFGDLLVWPARADFGELVSGEEVVAEVVVINRAAEARQLSRPRAACPCLRAPDLLLGPGRSARLQVVLDTEGMGGFIRRQVQYSVQDHGALTFELRGWLRRPFRAVPPQVELRRGGQTSITVDGALPFEVTSVQAEGIAARVRGCSPERTSCAIEISAPPSAKISTSILTIETRRGSYRSRLRAPIVVR